MKLASHAHLPGTVNNLGKLLEIMTHHQHGAFPLEVAYTRVLKVNIGHEGV